MRGAPHDHLASSLVRIGVAGAAQFGRKHIEIIRAEPLTHWQGWWNILTGHIQPGSAVAAVSRAPTKLDIFIVSKDQRIYTAAWDQNVNQGKWQGWWRIGP